MSKQLLTIGYEIPGFSENKVDFYDRFSLMDADILLLSPNAISPIGEWVSFTAGGGCYNVDSSKRFEEKILHLKKELIDYLSSGKNAFIFLSRKEEYQLAQSVSSTRKGQYSYSTKTSCNYDFLPTSIGTLTSAHGKHIKYSGSETFSTFDKQFNRYLEYNLYIENPKAIQTIYTGKDNKKALGALYKIGAGHLIVLPMLTINEADFIDTKTEKDGKKQEYWNKKAIAFGNNLVKCLLDIDTRLSDGSEKTPAPEWLEKIEYLTKKEIMINDSISKNLDKIAKVEKENESLKLQLGEEVLLKDLLFEKGKLLENAVIRALRRLGYQAEGYDDGDLEMDQVIISPEKNRYIGECEGKDSRDIDVTKFRQLQDALNADFARDEVEEKAFGILFGNAERLTDPTTRKLDFTTKCKSGAEREKIALVKTIDLFFVAKYLGENEDEVYKKNCRQAIHQCLGKVVEFPKVPNDVVTPKK
jgi:hypothetical protein